MTNCIQKNGERVIVPSRWSFHFWALE